MSWYGFWQFALALGLLVLIGFLIHVLWQLRRTLITLDEVLSNINKDLPSILAKLQLTLDGVNSELDRVEEIVTSFHDVRTKVHDTTSLVQRAFTSPVARMNNLLSSAKVAVAGLLKRSQDK